MMRKLCVGLAEALHFACHLAPWGAQSADRSEYMHWNGNFALLPLVAHWEYTQDAAFARTHTYPLLAGLHAWWGCFLRNESTPGGGYVLRDASARDPDQENENQNCSDPQIGLALLKRTLRAQLDIGEAIGEAPAPLVAEMLAHLPPLNVRACAADGSPSALSGATCEPGQRLWSQCAAPESHARLEMSDGMALCHRRHSNLPPEPSAPSPLRVHRCCSSLQVPALPRRTRLRRRWPGFGGEAPWLEGGLEGGMQ